MVQHCCTWLHMTLHMLLWVYMDLLNFIQLYLGSTWFCLTYLDSAIVSLKLKTIKFNFGRFIKLFMKIFSNKIYCYTVLRPLYLGSICAILTHSCLVGLRTSTAERSTPRMSTFPKKQQPKKWSIIGNNSVACLIRTKSKILFSM